MTIRTKVSGRTTVHAGPATELAAVALEYAAGDRGKVAGAEPCHFERVAEQLAAGSLGLSAGAVQFWPDRADGTPFKGPNGYGPDK